MTLQVPLKSLRSNPDKLQSITPALQALLAKNEQLREWAQRALVAYLKSVFLQPNKQVFDVLSVDVEGLATSMGLPSVPKLRFLQRARYRQAAKQGGTHGDKGEKEEEGEEQEEGEEEEDQGDKEGIVERRAPLVRSSHCQQRDDGGNQPSLAEDDHDDLFVVKRRDVHGALAGVAEREAPEKEAPVAKPPKRMKIKVHGGGGKRVVFDEEGNEVDALQALATSMQVAEGCAAAVCCIYMFMHVNISTRHTCHNVLQDDAEGAPMDGLDVGEHEDAAQRFSAAQRALQARDKGDKEAASARRKAARAEAKVRVGGTRRIKVYHTRLL